MFGRISMIAWLEGEVRNLYNASRDYHITMYHQILPKLKNLRADQEELARQIAELNKKIESLSATANEKKNTKKKNTGKTEFLTNQKRRDDEQ